MSDKPLAVMATTASSKTMADGTLRIAVDIQPSDMQTAFRLFGEPGSTVGIARLTDQAGLEAVQPAEDDTDIRIESATVGLPVMESRDNEPQKGPYGENARALVLNGFFLVPEVLKAIGTDDEFLTWLKFQKSAYSGKKDYDQANFQSYCVPAHVRRVANGAGTGIKPNYSAIPLTNEEHQLQHQKGESSIGSRDWWDKQRIKYVRAWARAKLKATLDYTSWTQVPPLVLCQWAQSNNVLDCVPYRIRIECGLNVSY